MKNILKVILFISILLGCIHYLNVLYTPKDSRTRAPYYELPNSLDVVYIGSSHIEWGIDAGLMWEDFGISALNYAIPGLDLKNSYFVLIELLKYQKPKVVVMDVYKIHEMYSHLALTNRLANAFKFSVNRLQMINENDSLTFSQKMDYFFPMNLYHTRNLEDEDFTFEYSNPERGHYARFDRVEESFPIEEGITGTIELAPIHQFYIQRIIDYAKEKDISIVFVKVPHLKAAKVMHETWNAIELYLDKQGIKFINYNKREVFEEAGLFYKNDVANDSENNAHLNHFGAKKVTLHLADILMGRFDLEDKRKLQKYAYLDSQRAEFKSLHFDIKEHKGWIIWPLKVLLPGDRVYSERGKFYLTLQHDGNIVLYGKEGNPVWASNTAGVPAKQLVMQEDGNWVLYGDNYQAFWATNTYDNGDDTYVKVDDAGFLALKKEDKVLWKSDVNLLATY